MQVITLDDLPPGSCCTFVRWTHARPGPGEVHTHTFHELFWIEEGEGVEAINGRPRALRPGMLVLTRAEDRHGFSSGREGRSVKFVNFAFPLPMWTGLCRRFPGLRGNYFDRKSPDARVHQLDPAELARLRVLSHDLQAGNRDAFTTETFLAAVMSLLVNRDRLGRSPARPAWLADACARIRTFPHFAGGTPALAKLAGRSPEHVSRALKQHTGLTPTEVVNDARLHHAALQLCTTDRPILDIAAECGLENTGHFYALFRARFKTTPRRYRLENAYPPEVMDGMR